MKKIILAVLVSFLVFPLMAQDMTPPKPVESPMMKWLEGAWTGTMDGPMGKSEQWHGFKMDLNGQFLLMWAKVKMGGNQVYEGKGAISQEKEKEGVFGVWLGNYRDHYTGKGKEDANRIDMEWKGNAGKSMRAMEKVGPDKMKITASMNGKTYVGEFTRVKEEKK
ncbi:MAG: DUF1579 domain-containing protein [bacterium]|nr:DUF1579 domain-containing protein [bacterium]